MLSLAHDINAFPSRVSYVNNQRSDLEVFDLGAFDFILSNIVLQHVAPDLAMRYIEEFFRVLAADGALVFQIPSHPRVGGDTPAPSGPAAMPDEAYQAAIAVTGAGRLGLRPGASMTLDVVITNRSPHPWSAAECGVIRAGNHWLDGGGDRMLRRDDGRSGLPGLVRPGDSCHVALTITAPDEDGDYLCEIDLAHEGVLWFHDRGSPTARLAVRVGAISHLRDSREPRPEPSPSYIPEREVDLQAVSSRLGSGGAIVEPGDFPMHGIARERIVEVIARHGGRLVHIEDDHSCGDEWVSFRYYVTR
jgi:hypothetical protein